MSTDFDSYKLIALVNWLRTQLHYPKFKDAGSFKITGIIVLVIKYILHLWAVLVAHILIVIYFNTLRGKLIF